MLSNIPAWQRKHFTTMWVGHVVSMAVMLLVVAVSIPPSRPDLLLMVYSLWAAAAAMNFLAHATEAGIYYMVAAMAFCLSILMAITPYWAPLEVAVFMSANMAVQALYLRKHTQQPAAGTPVGVNSATTIEVTTN
jgi:hypothetical protein